LGGKILRIPQLFEYAKSGIGSARNCLPTYATVATCQLQHTAPTTNFPLNHGHKSLHLDDCLLKLGCYLDRVFYVIISVHSPLSLHKCHPMILSTPTTTPTVTAAVFLPGFRAIPSFLINTYTKTKPRQLRVSRESEN